MSIFKRKKKETALEIPVIPHEHTWKDMPWYMDVAYDGGAGTASYKIIEPYICVTCGERKNVCLEGESWQHIDASTREEFYTNVRKRYKKYLKPRAVVEDMINNILLVKSPDYLNMVEEMRGLPHKNCGTSAEMKQVRDTEFKINLPSRDYGDIKK